MFESWWVVLQDYVCFASARHVIGLSRLGARDNAFPTFAQRTGSHDAGRWRVLEGHTTPASRAGCAEGRQILEGFQVVLFFYPRFLRAKSERMMRGAMRCGWMSWQRVGYGACFCLPGCPAALVLRWMGGAVDCPRWGFGGYV